MRIGLANLAGPGSAARTAAPAIGLGVALLAAVVLIQSSLLAQVTQVAAPKAAPALVFTEIPGEQGAAFDAAVAAAFGRPLTADDYLRMPFATGRIIAVRGQPVDRARIDPRRPLGLRQRHLPLGHRAGAAGTPASSPAAGGRPNYAGPPLVALRPSGGQGRAPEGGRHDHAVQSSAASSTPASRSCARSTSAASGPTSPLVLDPAALAGANLRQVAIAKATPAGGGRASPAPSARPSRA